ncbi:MAG: DUF3500 domain-containing protein [Gemmatimonadetes bacterium]|nr:DUF3500 domain-containing protein [Gemmatimonadota bacterium]
MTATTNTSTRSVKLLIVAVVAAAGAALVSAGGSDGGAASVPGDSDLADAAVRFLATLDAGALDRATYELGDEERFDWKFVPTSRNGLPLKDMTLAQRSAAHDLLATAMSAQGYLKAGAVMELERILGILEGRPERRDPEDYYVTVFGEPGPDQAWGWRFEGHHLSLNFSSPAGAITITGPAFMGANPAVVPSGEKAGWRPLGKEEDIARALFVSLDESQSAAALIAEEAPRDIITRDDREATLAEFSGIPWHDLRPAQQAALLALIGQYTGNMAADAAHEWTTRIQADPSGIHFAWAGSAEVGEGHYYRVHSPAFLIEYDNTQNDANHIHSVWRDLENDFGGDALARHYETGTGHQ